MSKKILMIVDELPCHGRNGYSTYNRSFLDNFIENGCEVHICVTGPRLPSVIFDAQKLFNSEKPIFHYLHAFSFNKNWLPITRASLARAAHASLPTRLSNTLKNVHAKLPWRQRLSKQKSVVIGRRLSTDESAKVARLVGELKPEWVFVDTIFRTGFIPLMHSTPRLALIAHDVFYQRCESLAAQGTTASPLVTKADEARALELFDRIVAISDDDALLLTSLAPQRRVDTLTAPIPTVAHHGQAATDSKRLLYIGSRAHHNVQGMKWFLDEVWPTVLAAEPSAILDVVGSVCDELVGSKNVTLHGRVDNIAAVAGKASFAINPVLAGSGLKIKILDYLSHGLPCITTEVGGTGFPKVQPSPLILCNTARDFALTINLWLSQQTAVMVSRKAVPMYLNFFSLESFNRKLTALLNEV